MYFKKTDFVNIENLLNNCDNFYAHIDKKNKDKKETLKEHTQLCKKYFNKIIISKELDKIFFNFENIYLEEVNESGRLLFRELIMNTIAMHDIGKINPFFQSRKMDNKAIEYVDEFSVVKSQHSILSSILYIDYFSDKIIDLPKEDRVCIRPFMFLNAYIISKHHGDLDEFKRFIDKLDDDGEVGVQIINIFNKNYKNVLKKEFNLSEVKIKKQCKYLRNYFKKIDKEKSIYLYTYARLLYSILVACDFYATTEFMNGIEINEFGEISDINQFYDAYKNTDVNKLIRKYAKEEYIKDDEIKDLKNQTNINILRNEMFLDAENELAKTKDDNVFFLEAPTGSGKSNVSMNLSFKLIEQDTNLKKIFYVYPFNTLVEQNLKTLEKIFENNREIFSKIVTVNSISPIKMDEDRKKSNDNEDNYEYYAEALLNKQFLNYPMVLTTHVSLFNTMFATSKESLFGFHQLVNSVIVLDEIQSYKNIIWTEIISFLKGFSKILNIKVIIMSATLPDLNLLTNFKELTANLITNREKYFSNPLFKDRVKISYELMEEENIADVLYEHVKNNSNKNKKIIIEFIKKESAYAFFRSLKNDEKIGCMVELMTGDDNPIERKRILNLILSEEAKEKGIVLVATQVIEAGVDIDMDIGYKDISKLDSDEQFMGRINRSCKKSGTVYFFNMDEAASIYKNDVRINKEFSLLDNDMRKILINKKFADYYKPVLELIKDRFNESFSDSNLNEFFVGKVGQLDFRSVQQRMKLIEDDNWSMSIYLCRVLEDEDGEVIDGEEIWENYKKLLKDNSMDYAEKQVKLSRVTSKMNNFIYQIKKNNSFVYDDKIGEIYCVKDGEVYFKDGKLDKEKFISQIGVFL